MPFHPTRRRITRQLDDKAVIGIFESLCGFADAHPMTVIFTAYDRQHNLEHGLTNGPETDEDVPHWLTDAALDMFEVDSRRVVEALAEIWKEEEDG